MLSYYLLLTLLYGVYYYYYYYSELSGFSEGLAWNATSVELAPICEAHWTIGVFILCLVLMGLIVRMSMRGLGLLLIHAHGSQTPRVRYTRLATGKEWKEGKEGKEGRKERGMV